MLTAVSTLLFWKLETKLSSGAFNTNTWLKKANTDVKWLEKLTAV